MKKEMHCTLRACCGWLDKSIQYHVRAEQCRQLACTCSFKQAMNLLLSYAKAMQSILCTMNSRCTNFASVGLLKNVLFFRKHIQEKAYARRVFARIPTSRRTPYKIHPFF